MARARPPAAESRPNEPAQIVVIEADDLIRGLLVEWLVEAGYGVTESRGGGIPRTTRPALVIVDLYMPRECGGRMVECVRRDYPDAPIIAMSAQFHASLGGSACAANALGVARVIAKPFTREDLLGAVRAVLAAGS